MPRRDTVHRTVWAGFLLVLATGLFGLAAADEASNLEVKEPINASVQVEKPVEQLRAEDISYNIPVLIGSKKQGLVQITPKEEKEINLLLRESKSLGLIRFASILAAKAEGFNDYTWRNVYLDYGPSRRGECRVKLQKSLYFRDIKHCKPINQVRAVQYAYIKYNNWDIAFSRFVTILERTAQIAGLALPISLRN